MKIGKVIESDYPITKKVVITAPVEVEVRGNNQVLTLLVNGKKVEAFRGIAVRLMKEQEEYEKAAF